MESPSFLRSCETDAKVFSDPVRRMQKFSQIGCKVHPMGSWDGGGLKAIHDTCLQDAIQEKMYRRYGHGCVELGDV